MDNANYGYATAYHTNQENSYYKNLCTSKTTWHDSNPSTAFNQSENAYCRMSKPVIATSKSRYRPPTGDVEEDGPRHFVGQFSSAPARGVPSTFTVPDTPRNVRNNPNAEAPAEWVKKCGSNLTLRPTPVEQSRVEPIKSTRSIMIADNRAPMQPSSIEHADDLAADVASLNLQGITVPTPKNNSLDSQGELQIRSMEEVAAENEELRQEVACKVCYDKIMDTVFLPCGHLACCHDCSQQLGDCPVCRQSIVGTVRTYMA